MKEKKSIIIKAIVIVVIVIICTFILMCTTRDKESVSKKHTQNVISNNSNNESNTNIANNTDIDENLENGYKVELTIEQKLYCICQLEDFLDGKKLSEEIYLKSVYNAINNGFIPKKNEYSENEINSIVYSIFNINLKTHKSIEGLAYENGIYKYNSQKENLIPKIENVEYDSAAGKMYSEYELYIENSDSKKEFIGIYIVTIRTNTENGERFIQSKSIKK